MPIQPLISIKAGKCNQDGTTVMPVPEPGLLYVYLNPEEELHHLCWKPRSQSEPEDDLLIIPGDARFIKYDAATTGRIFVLKFSSSSARKFYWLQSQSENPDDPGHWSSRDIEWGRRIDSILQGEEGGDGAEDEEMGDAPIQSADIEQEGDQSRRGGEDGGRAPPLDLASLIRGLTVPGQGQGQQIYQQQTPSISLHDLLAPATTLPALASASGAVIEALISNLPPALVPRDASETQKREIIKKILQSPQFTQGNISLSAAIREGALRGVADSLRVPLVPGEEAAGTDQVEILVKAVKREVEKDNGSA